jgi:hypothetical protein
MSVTAIVVLWSGCVFLYPVGCSSQPQSTGNSWSQSVRFTFFYDGTPLTIYNQPGDTLAPGRVVETRDEGNGTYAVDVNAIAGEYAEINLQGDTGWIRQADLWRAPLHRGVIMDHNGVETGFIPLPDYTVGIRVAVEDSSLVIDNDIFVVKANLTTRLYDDYMIKSTAQDIPGVMGILNLAASATAVTGDTVWGFDPYQSLVFAVDLRDTSTIDSIEVQGLPENSVVTGIARIGNAVYLWGLEYEFEACPLFQIPLAHGQAAAPLLQLSDEGGLLTGVGGEEFLFFERTGNIYRYDAKNNKLTDVQKPSINPVPYREIIYAESLDLFIGVLLSIYE